MDAVSLLVFMVPQATNSVPSLLPCESQRLWHQASASQLHNNLRLNPNSFCNTLVKLLHPRLVRRFEAARPCKAKLRISLASAAFNLKALTTKL